MPDDKPGEDTNHGIQEKGYELLKKVPVEESPYLGERPDYRKPTV